MDRKIFLDPPPGPHEVDKTFISGETHNKHGKRGDGGRGGLGPGKTPMVGAISRKGNVIARAIETVSADVLTKFVKEAVSEKVSLLVTDQWTGYRNLHQIYGDKHKVIRHTHGEYVVGSSHEHD